MNAYEMLKSLPVDLNGKKTIGKIMFYHDLKDDDTRNFVIREIERRAKGVNADSCDWDFSHLLDKMYLMNRMAKSMTCPKNLMNRFYKYKAAVIKKFWDDGKVQRVYDEGHYLCFDLIDEGKTYTFHQLKERCSSRFKIDETRECTVSDNVQDYEEGAMDNFQKAAVYYLHHN